MQSVVAFPVTQPLLLANGGAAARSAHAWIRHCLTDKEQKISWHSFFETRCSSLCRNICTTVFRAQYHSQDRVAGRRHHNTSICRKWRGQSTTGAVCLSISQTGAWLLRLLMLTVKQHVVTASLYCIALCHIVRMKDSSWFFRIWLTCVLPGRSSYLRMSLSKRRRYCGARRPVCRAVALCVCLSAEPRLYARRISLGGEGNVLYPVLSTSF